MSKPARGGPSLAEISLDSWVILGPPDLAASHIRRLAELGLRAGTRVRVLFDTVGGGRVIAVAEGRMALDGATCRRIPVTVASKQ